MCCLSCSNLRDSHHCLRAQPERKIPLHPKTYKFSSHPEANKVHVVQNEHCNHAYINLCEGRVALVAILILLSRELIICAECGRLLWKTHVVLDVDSLLSAALTPKVSIVFLINDLAGASQIKQSIFKVNFFPATSKPPSSLATSCTKSDKY